MNNEILGEIKRLNFEDILWVIFIILSILNIYSNECQKNYVISGFKGYEDDASEISIFVLWILVIVYLYFFVRNYSMYKDKGIMVSFEDVVKVVGSFLFVVGALCLLYFQVNSNDNFISDV